MKKKSLITMLVALSLTASVMVGATLAYLTAETGEVENVFTIGNVKINLDEPSWDPEKGKDLTPGIVVPKDPTVENTGANEAYVAVTVDGMTDMAAVGFAAEVNEGWVLVDETGTPDEDWDGSTLVDGKYAYTAVLAKGEKTPAVFSAVEFTGVPTTTEYTVEAVAKDANDESAGVYYVVKDAEGNLITETQFDTEVAARAYLSENMAENAQTTFTLTVKAYAIQTTGLALKTGEVYTWVNEIDFAEVAE